LAEVSVSNFDGQIGIDPFQEGLEWLSERSRGVNLS